MIEMRQGARTGFGTLFYNALIDYDDKLNPAVQQPGDEVSPNQKPKF